MDLSFDEQVAASAVAALGGMKRNRDDSPDAAGGVIKRGRTSEGGDPMEEDAAPRAPMVPLPAEAQVGVAAAAPQQGGDQPELKPFPYFYYRDFSKEVDPDPLVPLTPPGRVPNFPAKMHSILSRPDLADIICWMPHGRAWRVLKPREFEIRVIPTYFEHAKFSSFIRQANGWGFRRVYVTLTFYLLVWLVPSRFFFTDVYFLVNDSLTGPKGATETATITSSFFEACLISARV